METQMLCSMLYIGCSCASFFPRGSICISKHDQRLSLLCQRMVDLDWLSPVRKKTIFKSSNIHLSRLFLHSKVSTKHTQNQLQ